MYHQSRRRFRPLVACVVCALTLAACHDSSGPSTSTTVSAFGEKKLIEDNSAGVARVTDASLVNPWGIAFNSTGIMWIADNGSATSTVYDTAGAKQALSVTIPSKLGATGGTPTGIVVNTTPGFVIPTSTAAHWIFANLDGTIAAWSTGTGAHIVANRSSNGAVYTGLALATSTTGTHLYAANFGKSTIDVFDSTADE